MKLTIGHKDRWTRSLRGLVVGSILLLATGCDQVTGGGWIPSQTGANKANFGFSIKCRNTPTGAVLYDGQLQWEDGSVSFHGTVEPDIGLPPGVRCQDIPQHTTPNGFSVSFGGTYRPQPSGAPGHFEALVQDLGEPGKISGDSIAIALSGGAYSGYFNSGQIQGGNIQVH